MRRTSPGTRSTSRCVTRLPSPSDGDQLAVLAPCHAEPVADLADRRVRADGLDDRRHQVLAGRGSRLEGREGLGPADVVAFGAHALDALDVATLSLGIDPLDGR